MEEGTQTGTQVGQQDGAINNNNGTETQSGQQEGNQPAGQENQNIISDDEFNRRVQSAVDKLLADERKNNAKLTKQLKELQGKQLSTEEKHQLDLDEKEDALNERELAITKKQNKIFAIEEIKKAGLDDGSENALKLVDIIMGDTEEQISANVSAFAEYFNAAVTAKVQEKFKESGRTPGNANHNPNTKYENTIAQRLGETRANALKTSQEVLQHYLGGK